MIEVPICDLSGSDLDIALGRAVGYSEVVLKQMFGLFCRPKFHASVDEIRRYEPDECAIDVQRRSQNNWAVTIFQITPWTMMARESGTSEPEARARALLSYLRRVKDVDQKAEKTLVDDGELWIVTDRSDEIWVDTLSRTKSAAISEAISRYRSSWPNLEANYGAKLTQVTLTRKEP